MGIVSIGNTSGLVGNTTMFNSKTTGAQQSKRGHERWHSSLIVSELDQDGVAVDAYGVAAGGFGGGHG